MTTGVQQRHFPHAVKHGKEEAMNGEVTTKLQSK